VQVITRYPGIVALAHFFRLELPPGLTFRNQARAKAHDRPVVAIKKAQAQQGPSSCGYKSHIFCAAFLTPSLELESGIMATE